MKSCFYDTILKDYTILLKNTQLPNKVLLRPNSNFLQYSLNQSKGLFPKGMLNILYVLGKVGDTALFHSSSWKLSKQACYKVYFISKDRKSPK